MFGVVGWVNAKGLSVGCLSCVALLALEVPCAMPMCPARHYEMPESGEIN